MKKYFTFLFVFFIFYILFFIFIAKTYAVTETDGDLQVSYDEPLFPSSIIWHPGLTIAKSFSVKNLSGTIHTTYIKVENTSQTGNIAEVYLIKISEGAIIRYGENESKTLKKFWEDSGVNLSDIGAGGSTNYDVTISLPSTADNEYQGKSAKFDLIVGFVDTGAKVTVTSNSATVTPTVLSTINPALTPPGEILGLATKTAEITATPTAIITEGQIKGAKTSRLSKKLILGLIFSSGSAALFLIYYSIKKH